MRFQRRYKYWQILVGFFIMGLLYTFITTIFRAFGANELIAKKIGKPVTTVHHNWALFLHMFLYITTFFYFAINYFYTYISKNRKWFAFIPLILIFFIVSSLYYTFLYYNAPQLLQKDYSSLGEMYVTLTSSTLPMLIVCFLFAFGTYLWESQKQRRILEAQKLILETQISQANFNFLKAQINPHFLHNTLNFLYAKSLPYAPELSEGILTLSDIMRYALSQGNQKDGKAPLKDEIEHVHNVIKISQLRYNNQLKVNFEVTGSIEGKMIIPFVLITIVENAFKHGDLKNEEAPIDIQLDVKGNKLYFYCRNKKKKGPKQLSTGIGLDNIHKRLELAYGDKYKFIVKDEMEFYTTELTITEL
jgi:two-component system LytT family sensor kinase